jgi:hypothetical protein
LFSNSELILILQCPCWVIYFSQNLSFPCH